MIDLFRDLFDLFPPYMHVTYRNKEYNMAFREAFASSWALLNSWVSLLSLLLSPVWQLLVVVSKAAWPHVRSAAWTTWRFQASLSLMTLCTEAAVVTLVILLVMLRRYIVRRRYMSRAHRSVLVLRARFHRRYVSFTLAVERNFWLSARALPHVMYWVAASLLMWLAPELTSMACEHLWVWVAVTWPTLSALYLLLLVRSDDLVRESRVMPLDIDKVLRYWVVFTAAQCLQALTEYVPFASAIVESIAPPILRTIIFFAVVWMHLPGPGSGLHVS